MSADSVWNCYRRRGEVTAKKLSRAWRWTTPHGDQMEAQPGDWAVTDDSGNERSVAAGVFERTHEQVGPQRYRRAGTVLARTATRREVTETLEGKAVAHVGDWILRGENGEQWVVPANQFRTTYEGPLDADISQPPG
ncbi:hypothetical protein [Mycobacteroides franklinii]|uniref:Uncharacterized protein n=1 Tax=Mycobacteroides franklinii TaxID=948102 RepID=A0A4R5PBB9_9MYCO|nr:hypothetical protein [Mycobacteroides franklinii]ORA61324.1 hypothetical protein BST24_11070 [Mycobacteroides franklinii]TDH22017.1 hypothetical protein EJ571_08635 [Mycobacteroides franklinii]TDZ43600.1 hypothetical protein CCUG64054_03658 [Mycobacteroides franklinii]TDZ50735.1 hypothetical protein CCUG63697_02244 [Mycobacteroides franklinii]TDZ57155.1 hypothetical protein CCUG63696_03660 [Mycobacteroides franklinii]